VQQDAGTVAQDDTASATPTVDVRGVVKRYPLFPRRRDRALALLGRSSGIASLTALDGVSLQAAKGEAVGLIGENGSGKSTLLRLIAGISDPTSGEIRVTQPVAAILELGLGFHPDFSGRDNALLYGELIGVSPEMMHERLAEVLGFAELGDFIDQPLRTYSSGMKARLAFAVATNVDPRVLVVDEALAVGDGAFQKKCVDRMVRFKEEGRTVLFCSHAMYLVAGFCERAIWLHHGKVTAEGEARDVIHAYEDYLRHRGKRVLGEGGEEEPVPEGQLASLRDLRVEPHGEPVHPGAPVTVAFTVVRKVAGLPLHVAVNFEDEDCGSVATFATLWDGERPLVGEGEERVRLTVPECTFVRGQFDVTVFLADESGLQVMDQLMQRHAITIAATRWEPGFVRVVHSWEASSW
jgi:homopolymeric O-antigen transport system ATP-binding protein